MKDKGKITMMQAVVLFLVMTYSGTIRAVARYTNEQAEQAAWLTPVVGLLFLIILILIVKRFITKYPNKSFADIMCDIMGKPLGKIIIVVYILWCIILLALYVRYFDERLLSTTYKVADIKLFPIILLVLVGVILRSGFVVIARMNKIIFPLLAIQFFLIIILMIPNIDINYITPISYLDIVPVFKGSLGVIGIWIYFFFLFMLSDKIITNKNFRKSVLFSTIFIFIATASLLIMLLGIFGSETLKQIPIPFLIATKNISKGGGFSGLESLFLSVWILADFISVTLFAYIIIRLLKSLFGLQNAMPLLSILLIFIFFLSLFITNEVFELHAFSEKLGLPMNAIMGFGVPVIVFFTGKARKKL